MPIQNSNRTDDVETRAVAGDSSAFGVLIRLHDPDLRGVAWAVVQNGPDTDDVMQAAYEKAFVALPSFDGRSAIKTWLHSIIYRTAIDHVRYEGRRRHDDITELAMTAGSESISETVEARLELAETFGQLTEEQRALMMLCVGMGYRFDEVAEITGMPRGTVASKVGRARETLRSGSLTRGEHR